MSVERHCLMLVHAVSRRVSNLRCLEVGDVALDCGTLLVARACQHLYLTVVKGYREGVEVGIKVMWRRGRLEEAGEGELIRCEEARQAR
jgi:hypothetical protein